MSKTINDDTTKKIADLIKIKIPNSDIPQYTSQLNTVLESVEVLGELDTKDVPITSQTHGMENVLREDEPKPGLNLNNYKNVRNFKNGYFLVKKVL